MSATVAIARRELMSYVLSPVGAVVTALFLFFTGLVYFVAAPLLLGSGFSPGQPATMRLFFEISVWVFFLVGPALSMRTVSDELRLGTLEMLMTAPVGETQVIVGKFIGALGFLLLMLAPTLVFVVALEWYGRPDYGEILSGYVGLVLVGSAFLASGILASTLTSSQVLAYLTTIFLWLVVLLATIALPNLAALAEGVARRPDTSPIVVELLGALETVARFLAAGSPIARMRGFILGLMDSFGIVYFVSFTIVFLVAAIRSLGLRRWP
ncbi:MAG: ABC transporter permease subunit [Phycisphaerales bacterium]|nr:ABC transporter permease [Phycisphaerae bacterium]NNF44340.1 ABC transporter permease subunit [Phycisphaerales bacterium]NNM25619.1 ABC transporter permease subunit [Phycisphaerales bacterium]